MTLQFGRASRNRVLFSRVPWVSSLHALRGDFCGIWRSCCVQAASGSPPTCISRLRLFRAGFLATVSCGHLRTAPYAGDVDAMIARLRSVRSFTAMLLQHFRPQVRVFGVRPPRLSSLPTGAREARPTAPVTGNVRGTSPREPVPHLLVAPHRRGQEARLTAQRGKIRRPV